MPLIPPLQPGKPLTPAGDAATALALVYTPEVDNITLPIDPARVAHVYGVPVFEHSLQIPAPGYLDWDEKGAFIVVDAAHRVEYHRFVVACELGVPTAEN